MSILRTHKDEGETIDLTTNWQTFNFSEPITKLRLLVTGDLSNSPIVEIKLNNSSSSFLLTISQTFQINGHVTESVSFRRILGNGGSISIYGARQREGVKIFTRKEYATFEEIEDDFEWKTFTFPKSVSKLQLYSVGFFSVQPVIEYKIKNVEGSFLIGFADEINLYDHIIDEVQYRFNSKFLDGNAYASIIGFAKREEGE